MEGGSSIHAHWLARVACAPIKRAVRVVAWHVPTATHNIVYMLAESGCVGAVLATTEAEFCGRDKISPLVELLELPERRRKNEASDRVAIAICAMGIKLTALIACRDVDFGQVPDTSDLDIVRGLYKMSS